MKRGVNPRNPEALSTVKLSLWVTPSEAADIRVAANESGLSIAELIRRAVFATKVSS